MTKMTMDEVKESIGDAITTINKIVTVAQCASDAYSDNKDRLLELTDVIIDYSVALQKNLNRLYEDIG